MADDTTPEIDTTNEWLLSLGTHLPNHSQSIAGRPKFVAPVLSQRQLVFRTKQQAYRFASYLIELADSLADEEGEHSFDEVLDAVRNV